MASNVVGSEHADLHVAGNAPDLRTALAGTLAGDATFGAPLAEVLFGRLGSMRDNTVVARFCGALHRLQESHKDICTVTQADTNDMIRADQLELISQVFRPPGAPINDVLSLERWSP